MVKKQQKQEPVKQWLNLGNIKGLIEQEVQELADRIAGAFNSSQQIFFPSVFSSRPEQVIINNNQAGCKE